MAEQNSASRSTGAPYDARAIANLVLDIADEMGARITQMQLYKIIYFAHGWYLSSENRPLICQDFQAWSYGPVVKIVRDSFKSFGDSPISGRADKLDIFTGEFVSIDKITNNYDVDFVRKIVDFYHVFDGWQLSDMTHEKGSPWDLVWNSEKPIGNLGLTIEEGSIMKHFTSIPKRFSMN
jgi:uncharacterized phage-associated protein